MAGFANGMCAYDFISEYATECNVRESSCDALNGGNCDVDVDECASDPCQNDATCTDSTDDRSISFHAYRCTCKDGFANGVCEYDFITEYTASCSVSESSGAAGVDDESWSDVNGNGCERWGGSTAENMLPCALAGAMPGADGRTAADACCACQPAGPSVGNCDIDVEECASDPCQNGAE